MSKTKATRKPSPLDDDTSAVTGVAAGNLGTRANLEDTQVLKTLDLAEPDAGEPGQGTWFAEADATPEPDEPSAGAVTLAEPEAATPNPARPVARRRRPGRPSHPTRGLAGLVAAVLVALASVAVLTMGGDRSAGAGQVPAAADPTEQVPTDVAADPNGNNGNNGNGCRGEGRGNGNCPTPEGDGGGGDDDD